MKKNRELLFQTALASQCGALCNEASVSKQIIFIAHADSSASDEI